MVQFGMCGALAPAIGLGELVVLGHAGSEVIDGVLHVPDLVVSLFSERAALARGMAVHFCPATSPDIKEKVCIERGGSVVFSVCSASRRLMLVLELTVCSSALWSLTSTAKHNDVMLLYAFGYRLAKAMQLPCPATQR
jgi:hypothetical protein